VDAIEVLNNNVVHSDGGTGMDRGVETAKNPKEGDRSTNEDVGRNSPCAAGKHRRSKHQQKYAMGPRRGHHSHKKEKQNEESIPMWFYIGIIAHKVENKRNNRTSAPVITPGNSPRL
jgi:hypothetical protein